MNDFRNRFVSIIPLIEALYDGMLTAALDLNPELIVDSDSSQLSEETANHLICECMKFYYENATAIQCEGAPLADLDTGNLEKRKAAMAGHDLWLTRCGHGAGFWDGDWPEPHATQLDSAAKALGNIDLYIGDDGLIYGG